MKRRDVLIGTAVTGATLAFPMPAGREGQEPDAPVPKPSGTKADTMFPFADSDIKFRIEDMMGILKDDKHEGWRRVVYPDPVDKDVSLIGAGFNLNAPEIPHSKGDPADPYQYNDRVRKEPSTEALWNAAGLNKETLDGLRTTIARNEKFLGRRRFVYKALNMITSDISDEEARRLLYVSSRQAVHNAMAYSKDFGNMSDSQQMGMSQLVYQMGSRLEGFHNFLNAVNDTSFRSGTPEAAAEHWKTVQSHLIDSDWFRKHTDRAVNVTAMFDPHYDASPDAAEQRVKALAAERLKGRQHGESEQGGRVMLADRQPSGDRGRG